MGVCALEAIHCIPQDAHVSHLTVNMLKIFSHFDHLSNPYIKQTWFNVQTNQLSLSKRNDKGVKVPLGLIKTTWT